MALPFDARRRGDFHEIYYSVIMEKPLSPETDFATSLRVYSRPVFIVGFMGSGKTTLGKKLAKICKVPFIDLDQHIIEASGMSISDYFKLHGEESFRTLEEQVLKSIPTNTCTIVSTGGGAPCSSDNMTWMNSHGLTLYLNLTPKALLSRLITSDKNTRPLLSNMNDDELLDYIENKLKSRSAFYEKAKININPLRLSPQDILAILTKEIQSM